MGAAYCTYHCMKTFTLTSPPPHAGIYVLRNTSTGELYVGQTVNLRRRYQEWRGVFATALKASNLRILEIIQNSNLNDWVFGVLYEAPGADPKSLDEMEAKAINKLHTVNPDKVLNVMGLAGKNHTPGHGNPAKSVITYQGEPISYNEAVRRLGTSTKQLQKRLKKRRDRGETTTRLEELVALSAQYKTAQTTPNGATPPADMG